MIVDAPNEGISADLTFEGRAFPVQEPRFTHRVGPPIVPDYMRMTQNGRWTGWIEVDGVRRTLAVGAVGTRDRSWGVRPVGGSSDVPVMPEPGGAAVLGRWCPTNFDDFSLFFHIQHDLRGYLNSRTTIVADRGGAADAVHFGAAEIATVFESGTRYAAAAVIRIEPRDEPEMRVRYRPVGNRFLMTGIGHFNAACPHGGYKGALSVARVDIMLADAKPLALENIHVQTVALATLEQAGRAPRSGIGVIEQIVLRPYAPLGFKGVLDPAA